jgi:glycosyltransferase involved in cell wall biosynthesis
VIVPTHNRSDLLPRAVRSVLGQTYENLECIVVDDASSDDTEQVMRQVADERFRYLRRRINQGASAARNTGIAQAKGDLVAFLDDDDEWLPTKLAKQVLLIQSLPADVGMVYCWMDYCDSRGRLVRKHRPTHRGYVFPSVLDEQRIGGCQTLLVRRSVIDRVGGFDEELPRGNDGDFIRRVSLKYRVDLVPEVLVRVHIGHGHVRISQPSRQGIRNAIKGQMVKLVKFKDELRRYPRQKANIYATIAYHHSQLGEWSSSLVFYRKSISTFPFSAPIYAKLLRSLAERLKTTSRDRDGWNV